MGGGISQPTQPTQQMKQIQQTLPIQPTLQI